MAAKKRVPDAVSDYLSQIGRKGGEAKVPKGFSTMDAEKRSALAKKAVAARWAKVKATKKAAARKAVKKTVKGKK